MDISKLTEIIGANRDIYSFGNLRDEEYSLLMEKVIENIRPDFVAILNPEKKYAVLFEIQSISNFNKCTKESIYEIIEGIDPSQLKKILKIDNECMKFVRENEESNESKLSFRLSVNSVLANGKNKVLLRNIEFINVKIDGLEVLLPLVCLSDETGSTFLKTGLSFEIRLNFNTNPVFINKIKGLKSIVQKIVEGNKSVTARENEVLKLIALGKTSKEIAQLLFIAVTTVNTHRQNLIKKFEVKNTTSLINIMNIDSK